MSKERVTKNNEDDFFSLVVEESSLKLVKIRKNRVVSYNYINVPEGIISGEQVRSQKKLAELINKLRKDAKPRADKSPFCTIGLPENQIFIQTIEVPKKLTNPEISRTVEHKSDELFPVPYKDMILDWQVVSEDEKNKNVLIIAAPGKLIKSIVKSVRIAGIEPLAIEPKSFSVSRLLNFILKKQSLIIIDFEKNSASLSIYQNGQIKFHTKISPPLAFDKVAGAISRTLHYYQDKHPKAKPISRVILSGDTGDKVFLEGIGKKFNEVQVEKITLPKLKAPEDFEDRKTFLASAIALALAKINIFDKHQSINLLPTEIKSNHRVSLAQYYLGLITRLTGLFLVFLIGILVVFNYKLSFDEQKLVGSIEAKQNYKISDSLKNKEEIVERVNNKSRQINKLYQNSKNTPKVVKYIIDRTPKNVSLTSINLEQNRVVISGIGSRADIIYYKDRLAGHEQITGVSLPLSSLSKKQESDFKIIFNINP